MSKISFTKYNKHLGLKTANSSPLNQVYPIRPPHKFSTVASLCFSSSTPKPELNPINKKKEKISKILSKFKVLRNWVPIKILENCPAFCIKKIVPTFEGFFLKNWCVCGINVTSFSSISYCSNSDYWPLNHKSTYSVLVQSVS